MLRASEWEDSELLGLKLPKRIRVTTVSNQFRKFLFPAIHVSVDAFDSNETNAESLLETGFPTYRCDVVGRNDTQTSF